jgi:hypothetical protein
MATLPATSAPEGADQVASHAPIPLFVEEMTRATGSCDPVMQDFELIANAKLLDFRFDQPL